jgi:hypothetical protein
MDCVGKKRLAQNKVVLGSWQVYLFAVITPDNENLFF